MKEPRQRIIESAMELFGEKGFKETTVRDISRKADTNLALVNYYFRNKENLYKEIFMNTIEEAFTKNPVEKFISAEMPPETKLRNFIRLIMHRLMGPEGLGSNNAAVQMFARELTNPTVVLGELFENYISKVISIALTVVTELLGEMDRKEALRFASSIIGQCMHPLLAGNILKRAGLEIRPDIKEIEEHALHIYRFSLNGIKDYMEKN